MSALVAATTARRRWLAIACLLSVFLVASMPDRANAAPSSRLAAAKKRAASAKKKRQRAAKRRSSTKNRTPDKKRGQQKKPASPGGSGASTSVGAPSGTRFGINDGVALAGPPAMVEAMLNTMKAGGIHEVRSDLSWITVEPRAPSAAGRHFDFSVADRKVSLLARAGIRWFPILSYSTEWSGRTKGDPYSRPANPVEYGAYVDAVAARYGRGGTFWSENPQLPALPFTHYEIWNEPNFSHFWREQATAPEDYADLVAAAYAALKRRDPAAQLVTGGLVESGAHDFLVRMYAHRPDLRNKIDAIGFHAYNPTAEDMLATISNLRSLLERLDPGVALEITEAGFDTLRLTEIERQREIRELVRGLRQGQFHVTGLSYFAAITDEKDPKVWNQWLGIWHRDGTPKPSGIAYLTEVASAQRS